MSLLSKTKDLFRRTEKPHSAKATRGESATQKKKKVTEKEAAVEKSVGSEEKAVTLGEVAARIGLTPLMTEKGMAMAAQAQTAVFRVRPGATKGEIVRAIQEQYQVKTLKVRTVYMRGKRRMRGRTVGLTTRWKKAYVKVDDVQKLHISP